MHVQQQIRACACLFGFAGVAQSLGQALAGQVGPAAVLALTQHHSVGVLGAETHPTPGSFGISMDCLALRGNSKVQPGNKYMFYPVTIHLCQMLSVEYVSGNTSRLCSEDLLRTGSAAGISVLTLWCKDLPLPPAPLQHSTFLSHWLNNFMVCIETCALHLPQGSDSLVNQKPGRKVLPETKQTSNLSLKCLY